MIFHSIKTGEPKKARIARMATYKSKPQVWVDGWEDIVALCLCSQMEVPYWCINLKSLDTAVEVSCLSASTAPDVVFNLSQAIHKAHSLQPCSHKDFDPIA